MRYKTILTSDEVFPTTLQSLSNPPESLYYKGKLSLLGKKCISIVGSRKMSDYGEEILQDIIPELVDADFTIISGLAYGIDACAHKVALECGGNCCAVLGSGIDKVYPYDNAYLYEEIIANGLLITEYPPGTPPLARHFPERNRIIAALSHVTLVVEASERSGSMITARLAAEMGKTVGVIPGDITRHEARGIAALINEGARAITCAEDIFELYESSDLTIQERIIPALAGTPATVLQAIGKGYHSLEEICYYLHLRAEQVSAVLTTLEMDHFIVYKQNQWQKTS